MNTFTGIALLIPLFPAFQLPAAQHPVTSAADIAQAAARAQPGDVLVMRDGDWTDQAILFRGHGTADKPITLQPSTPGKVRLTGKS